MHLSVGCLKVLCLLLLSVKDTCGQMQPANAAAQIGGGTIFSCSDLLFYPSWIMSKDGTSTNQLLIASGCTVNTNLQDHYAVDKEGVNLPLPPFVCNLIVFNVTMDQAGVYWCTGSGDRSNVLLTVLDSSPRTTSNKMSDVMEGEIVVITCILIYNGSVEPAPTLRPHFYWTNNTGNNASNVYNAPPSNNSVVSQLTVTAGRQTIMPYTCHVYLQLMPPVTVGYATNIPSVDSNSSSQNITVLYKPSRPVTTSRPEVITINGVPCGINVLTCSNSTGNPAPSYRWYDTTDNVILTDNNTLTLAEVDRSYKCEAYNTIRNVMHNASTNTTVSTDKCTSTTGQQCCVFPRKETTLVTVKGCDNGTLCDCSQGNSSIMLTCNAKTFPNASYTWTDPNGQVTTSPIFDKVTMNGMYRCTAYFNKSSSNYTGDVTFPNGTNETTVGKCYTNPADTTDQIRTIILACVLGGYGLLNLIATIAFIVYYNRKSNTVNKERQAFTFRNKMTLNARFPWLRRMLPCMNESEGNSGCTFLWVLLFILMSIFAGIIVFPILVAMANCSRENNDSRDDPGIGMSNVYQEDTIDRNAAATKSSTDAHGHVEAPYDEIGTMHPGRKVVLEEPTSSKNKDARKVFYTRVNPNFNTEEGVERYSVSS